MTNEDKQTSYCVLRNRLFMAGYTDDYDADDDELRRALQAIPDGRYVGALLPIIGNDGLWAARQVMGEDYFQWPLIP